MKPPISISFAPNFQKKDIQIAGKLFMRVLFGIGPQNEIATAKERLAKITRAENVSLFSSARAALYFSLQALNLQKDDEVILQAFTCVAVPCSIVWAGLKPVFVDVDEETYNMSLQDLQKKISPRTKAIIVQHTFGIPAPIDEIQKLTKDRGIFIIEDCAHTIGDSYKNKPLGTWGDVAVYSFGRDKMLSSVFGGAAVSNDPSIAQSLSKYEGALQKPPRSFVLQQLMYPLIYALSLPFYNIGFGKALLWLSGKVGLLSRAVYLIEKKGGKPNFVEYAFDPALATLLNNQLLGLSTNLEHRKNLSAYYIQALGLSLDAGKPYLRVPIQVDNKKKFINQAKQKNIHLGNWYRGAIDPIDSDLKVFGYTHCPVAENLALSTINLPTHINISKQDAEQIVSLCKTLK